MVSYTAILLLSHLLPCTMTMTNYTVLVSGYNNKMSRINIFQTQSGVEMSMAGTWDVDKDMTWLQVEGDMLYAAHEVEKYGGQDGGAVSRWKISETGLTRLESVVLPTISPAHILVSQDLGLVFTANYGGHSFTAVTLAGARLGDISYQETFQPGVSHPHQVVLLGHWVWVVDLGLDTIWHYTVQDKEVIKLGKTDVRAGMGPRHMVVDEQRNLGFLVGELQSVVAVYKIDLTDGSLELVQEVALSPHPDDYGGEILLAGGRVYASSRGSGVICVYNITLENKLVKIQDFYLGGSWPRHFAIKDQILLAADQRGDSVQLVNIDKDTGILWGGDMVGTENQPAFIIFLE